MEIKHRIAVAGCGGMSHTWIRYAKERDDCEIVALVDLVPASAERMKEQYGLTCGIYTDIGEAIAGAGAGLVFDVTIPASHHAVAVTAMEKGCHVFAEKPLAESMEECRSIVQASERTGRSHSVMQNRRYDPRIRAFRQLLADGTIGQPGLASADFFLGPHFGGFRDIMDSPLLLDMAIHTFDQARLILGADPVSVYCHEFNPPGSWYKGNASAICIFEMSDGSVFNYRGSWCAEGVQTSWEADWRVTGSKGTAVWDGTGAPYAEVVAPDADPNSFIRSFVRVDPEVKGAGRTFHDGCLDEMFGALAAGRPAETDCRDNIRSMEMVFGAIESARRGIKIYMKDL